MTTDERAEREPIAIIGMGCRLPGGIDTPDALWRLLHDNADVIGEVPPERWESYAARGPDHAAAVGRAIRAGGYLDDIAGFDAEFFGISPREAELMDPQQRLTLEVAWETLENAGIDPGDLAGTDAAVYMGVCCDDYGRRLLEDLPNLEAWTGIGASMCAVANRVSYALDLRGPSLTIDTACSASLVAIHQACQSLHAGDTSLALAGGVMLVTSPGFALVLEAAGALSPDGTSKAFDAAANGYVRSEGCAVIALKRHSDAVRDGDRVLALIRGGAVCQDGRTNGIMAPSRDAQAHLMRQAARNAAVPLDSIDYVEAHGTGTGIGDPIEAAALAATVGAGRPDDRPCLIGSVKSNLGHLEAASGVVGVLKLILALRHDLIPATLSRGGLNQGIPWDRSGLHVTLTNTPWQRVDGRPRRAGVGNYGYGGTLAHIVLEEAMGTPSMLPRPEAATTTSGPGGRQARLYPLSAGSPAALRATAGRLADWIDEHEQTSLAAVGHTLGRSRATLPVRAAVVAADRTQLLERLRHVAAGRNAPGVHTAPGRHASEPPVVWVFSGHGAQWAGMGRHLLGTEPELDDTFAEVDAIFREELGISPGQVVLDGDLDEVGRVQALTFLMQVSLARVWQARGLRPAAVIGHSVGEIAAAVIAGRLELTDAARLVCRRSRLLRKVAGLGAMAMVDLPFAEAAERLAGEPQVAAAIAAAPTSTVISGDTDAVERVLAGWTRDGLTVRRVNTDVAFHSHHMDPLLPGLLAEAAGLEPRTAAVPLYSTAMDDPRADPPRDAAYWVTNLRNPVRFEQAVRAAAEDGYRIFLEVSTHPVVAHSTLQTLAAGGVTDAAVVGTLRRGLPERETLLDNLAALYCLGVRPDWTVLHPGPGRAELPPTAWQHERYWADPASDGPAVKRHHDVTGHTVLGGRTVVQGTVPVWLWQTRLDDRTKPYPGGHRVLGAEILPAAVVLTTLLEAADGAALTDVALRVPIALATQRDVQVVRQDGELRLSSRLVEAIMQRRPSGAGTAAPDAEAAWATHATAAAQAGPDRAAAAQAGPDRAADGLGRLEPAPPGAEDLDPHSVMRILRDIGVVGIGFPWLVREIRRNGERLVVRIAADPDGILTTRTWASLLDGALSAAPVTFPGPPRLRMPGRLSRVTVRGPAPDEALVAVELLSCDWSDGRPGDTVVDVRVADLDGVVRAELLGVRFGVVQHADTAPEAERETAAGAHDWHDLSGDELAERAATFVLAVVAEQLRMEPDRIDAHRPLSELGVDSLLSESIRQSLQRGLPFALPSSLLWDRPSVAAVAGFVLQQLDGLRVGAGVR